MPKPSAVENIFAEAYTCINQGHYYTADALLQIAQPQVQTQQETTELQCIRDQLAVKRAAFKAKQQPFLVIQRSPKAGSTPQQQVAVATELAHLAQALLADSANNALAQLAQNLENAVELLSRQHIKKVISPNWTLLTQPIEEEARRISHGIKTGSITQENLKQPLRAIVESIQNLSQNIHHHAILKKGLTEGERRLWKKTIDSLQATQSTAPDNTLYNPYIRIIQDGLTSLPTVHATRYYTKAKKDHANVVKRDHHSDSVKQMTGVQPFTTSHGIPCEETHDTLTMAKSNGISQEAQYVAAIECLQQMAENTNFDHEKLDIRCHDLEMMKILATYAHKQGIPLGEFEYTGTLPLSQVQQAELQQLKRYQQCREPASYLKSIRTVEAHTDKKALKLALLPSILTGNPCPLQRASTYTQRLSSLPPQTFFADHVENCFKKRGAFTAPAASSRDARGSQINFTH
jgi:hypothetical protein